ncbi:hypothetical protein [Natranaerobius trueperi]|uniref:Uncharacterized protein n=1 Tax=Natranaerobius trueperi TaxID=759412 RepID=A0A226BX01_9FIRM|nr:hypothetical protein [Natranaerobius trueperi]OWZ82844.1 hypothetical protein CDO51_11820 [Natranaerobius trueperi]
MAILQGCSPGFWRSNLDDWTPTNKTPDDTIFETFEVQEDDIPFTPSDATLIQGLQVGLANPILPIAWRGFVRQAVAAILNAQHPEVNYPLTEAQVRQRFQDVIDGTREREEVEEEFAAFNDLGCPL